MRRKRWSGNRDLAVLASLVGGVRQYLLHDKFTTDRVAGAVNGTLAEPGPGVRVTADVENRIFLDDSRLRGGIQFTSPVWGETPLGPGLDLVIP